jgi:hypothetical protein
MLPFDLKKMNKEAVFHRGTVPFIRPEDTLQIVNKIFSL